MVQADTTHNDTFIVAYLCIFILAISIMMHGGNVSDEIVYCKTNIVMDLMLTSISPKTLFFGVTTSTGAVGLVFFVIVNSFLGYKSIHPEIVSVMIAIVILIISIAIITIFSSKMFRFGSTYYGNIKKVGKFLSF